MAEQQVDVEIALVDLVEDQGVVAQQAAIRRELGEQDAVGHALDHELGTEGALESGLEAHDPAEGRPELGGEAPRGGPRREPPRLGEADQPFPSAARGQRDLGQLGGLARAGLSGNDHHRMRRDRGRERLGLGGDREFRPYLGAREAGVACRPGGGAPIECALEILQRRQRDRRLKAPSPPRSLEEGQTAETPEEPRAPFADVFNRFRQSKLAFSETRPNHGSGVPSRQSPMSPTIDIGIPEADRARIAEGLSRLLADTYTLYLKTHNFHWNVTGPMFQTLHAMFEQQYTELAMAVDQIAERIRALGFPAPGSYAQFSRLTSIPEETGTPEAREMIRQLVAGQEAVVRTAREIFPIAEAARDQPTADLLTQRMQLHEKNAWMLRSLLE